MLQTPAPSHATVAALVTAYPMNELTQGAMILFTTLWATSTGQSIAIKCEFALTRMSRATNVN